MAQIKAFFGYLFDSVPGPFFSYYIPALIVIGLMILGAIIFSMIYQKRKKHDFAFKRLFKKVSTVLIVFAMIFLFLLGVRYESIPYFSMRFLLYVSILIFLYFVYRYIRIYKVEYPREKENVERKIGMNSKKEETYLPNKKKR